MVSKSYHGAVIFSRSLVKNSSLALSIRPIPTVQYILIY